MFIADNLIYLELQKTGGTHIRRLLQQYTHGEPVGKHNRLTGDISGKFIIGSIRNPWDWYVSLWAYGVGGHGALRRRCVRRLDFDYYHRGLPKSMGENWLSLSQLVLSVSHDIIKPIDIWRCNYADADDPELFRSWLKMLMSNRNRYDVGEGYAFSPLSSHAGFLTYRYLRLFTVGDRIFRDKHLLTNQDGIREFDKDYNMSRGMVKMESLEEDLIRLLYDAGFELKDEQMDAIRNKRAGKTNVSKRKPAEFYYDDETIELVAERDKYLIEKYQYQAPL